MEKRGTVLKELARFYQNYKVAKAREQHYREQLAIYEKMFAGNPPTMNPMNFDGMPHGSASRPDLLKVTEKIIEYQSKIDEENAIIEIYERTINRFEKIFMNYNNKKYTVAILRMNGMTNKEIAVELGLSHERIRHIVTELNREIDSIGEGRHIIDIDKLKL